MKGKTTLALAFTWTVAFRRAHFSSLLLVLLLPLNARVMEVLESYPLGTDGAEGTREDCKGESMANSVAATVGKVDRPEKDGCLQIC